LLLNGGKACFYIGKKQKKKGCDFWSKLAF
jgi:hypothetical protein